MQVTFQNTRGDVMDSKHNFILAQFLSFSFLFFLFVLFFFCFFQAISGNFCLSFINSPSIKVIC